MYVKFQVIKEKKRILSQRKIDNKVNVMDVTNEESKFIGIINRYVII